VSTQRVDKAWQRKGLKEYSTEAILGTLGHYGVQVDEAGFRQLAEKQYPIGIAQGWASAWKGTGQFSVFPQGAAEELWRRWLPERLSPYELSEKLAELMGALGELLQGSQEAAVGPAFERMEAVRKRIPLSAEGTPDEAFMRDALGVFSEESVKAFDQLAELLAAEGHVEDAEAFADLEEFLLPERRGISRAVVRAVKGEQDGAIEDLQKLAADGSRLSLTRLLAVDGLVHIKAYPQSVASGRALLEEAERGEDWHLALDLCARLEHAYQQLGDRAALQALARDFARLEAAHDAAHPAHKHH
jgi:hypothetical protein